MTPVNIVYPIDGASYPIQDATCKPLSAYFAASFSCTGAGGPHKVEWGFDGNVLAHAEFYDELSDQFVWKLPAGTHTFTVKSDCGNAAVKFQIT